MMLTGRNEWIAIAALILYIAFVPCPYEMKQFFASPIGKVVALATVVYAWKYVSCPVAILLLVAFLRSGSMREYLEGETGMTPPPTTSTDYKCPDEFIYSVDKKTCEKGTETRPPTCNDATMSWDAMEGKCKSSSTSHGGPAGGTTPGAVSAQMEMANASKPTTVESFTPYSKEKAGGEFAPA
jgi:hypothetical protein